MNRLALSIEWRLWAKDLLPPLALQCFTFDCRHILVSPWPKGPRGLQQIISGAPRLVLAETTSDPLLILQKWHFY